MDLNLLDDLQTRCLEKDQVTLLEKRAYMEVRQDRWENAQLLFESGLNFIEEGGMPGYGALSAKYASILLARKKHSKAEEVIKKAMLKDHTNIDIYKVAVMIHQCDFNRYDSAIENVKLGDKF